MAKEKFIKTNKELQSILGIDKNKYYRLKQECPDFPKKGVLGFKQSDVDKFMQSNGLAHTENGSDQDSQPNPAASAYAGLNIYRDHMRDQWQTLPSAQVVV